MEIYIAEQVRLLCGAAALGAALGLAYDLLRAVRRRIPALLVPCDLLFCPAVAAGVIGGVSPLGGTGLLLGTLAGAAVWQTLENGLSIIHAPVGIQRIVIGIIVVCAVLLDVVFRKGLINSKSIKKEGVYSCKRS